MVLLGIMIAYTVCVVWLCLTSKPQMKRDLQTRIKCYWTLMIYGGDHNRACEEADVDADDLLASSGDVIVDAHDLLACHLKKAGLSPDDKQDIIASERARRRNDFYKDESLPIGD